MNEMKAHPITMVVVFLLVGSAGLAQTQFARASDLKKLQTQVERVLILQLAESIRSLQIQVCLTPDGQTKRVLRRTLDDVQQDYTELTGERYPVQPCQVIASN